jgi:hypothetical protein
MDDLFSNKKQSFKEFIRTHLEAILLTLIFHVVVLIILIFVKVEGLKDGRELGVLIDFEEKSIKEILDEENVEIPAEFMELIQQQRELASNRAVNVNADDPFNSEISTEEYLQKLLDEIEAGRDEEVIRDREKWREILEAGGYIEPVEESAEESGEETYTGPTTITYEFLDAPLDRQKSYLTIPVYKCEGSGLVSVDAEVARDGSVIRADIRKPVEGADAECFARAATEAALSSSFAVAPGAPEKQQVVITYSFIAQ